MPKPQPLKLHLRRFGWVYLALATLFGFTAPYYRALRPLDIDEAVVRRVFASIDAELVRRHGKPDLDGAAELMKRFDLEVPEPFRPPTN